MGAAKIAWVWQAGGERGAAASLGLAQQAAEQRLRDGGAGLAVVESALAVRDPRTGRQGYRPTGRRCTARIEDGRLRWTPLGVILSPAPFHVPPQP